MAHARETIRKAIVTAVTGLTTTGARVVSRPIHLAMIAATPNLSVMVPSAAETKSSMFPNEAGSAETRTLPFIIEGRVSTATDYEDKLDDIAAEVEAALMTNSALAGLVLDLELHGTTIEISGEGETPVGLLTMEWAAQYRVDASAPTAVL